MTLDKLIIKTVVVQVLIFITKVLFFKYLNIELIGILVFYYILLSVISITTIRRLGIMNYFEIILITIIWLVLSLLIDLMITSPVVNKEIFKNLHFWVSYLIMILATIIFHKKLHVDTRRNMKK